MEVSNARREQLQEDLKLETDEKKRNKIYYELFSIMVAENASILAENASILAENAEKDKKIKELGEQLMESKISGITFSYRYLNQNVFH